MTHGELEAAKLHMYKLLSDGADEDYVATVTGLGFKRVRAVARNMRRRQPPPPEAPEPVVAQAPPPAPGDDPKLSAALTEIERQRTDIGRLTKELRECKVDLISLERRFRVIVPEDLEDRVRDLVARDEFQAEALKRLDP